MNSNCAVRNLYSDSLLQKSPFYSAPLSRSCKQMRKVACIYVQQQKLIPKNSAKNFQYVCWKFVAVSNWWLYSLEWKVFYCKKTQSYQRIHWFICKYAYGKSYCSKQGFFDIRQKKMDAARIGSYLCGRKKESNSGFISSRKRKFVYWRQVRNGNNGAPQSIVVPYS